jgi:DNA-binding MarR family transcriptional regulator
MIDWEPTERRWRLLFALVSPGPDQAPAGRALPTELTARGRRQLTVASVAVRRVEQDMLADLDADEQDQMREPPGSAT